MIKFDFKLEACISISMLIAIIILVVKFIK